MSFLGSDHVAYEACMWLARTTPMWLFDLRMLAVCLVIVTGLAVLADYIVEAVRQTRHQPSIKVTDAEHLRFLFQSARNMQDGDEVIVDRHVVRLRDGEFIVREL